MRNYLNEPEQKWMLTRCFFSRFFFVCGGANKLLININSHTIHTDVDGLWTEPIDSIKLNWLRHTITTKMIESIALLQYYNNADYTCIIGEIKTLWDLCHLHSPLLPLSSQGTCIKNRETSFSLPPTPTPPLTHNICLRVCRRRSAKRSANNPM